MKTKKHHHIGPALTYLDWAALMVRLDEIHRSKMATHARLGYLPDRLFPLFGGVSSADRRASVRLYYKARQYLIPVALGVSMLGAALFGAFTGGDYGAATIKTGVVMIALGTVIGGGLCLPFYSLIRTYREIYGESKEAKAAYIAALADYRARGKQRVDQEFVP